MESGVHNWLWKCTLPDTTELQEHTLKTDRSIVIGDHCKIDYGLQGDDIMIAEMTTINGNILADGDIRIDNWCVVTGDVVTYQDAFLGEGVKIHGRLIVTGDLDIGDNVQIEKGFEAKGWISIRNPLPVITYIILYLVTLIGLEREDEIDEFLDNLFGEDEKKDEADEIPLMIPPASTLDMEVFGVTRAMTIGVGCRLHGNIRAQSISVLENNTMFGSLRAEGPIIVGKGTTVHGNVISSDAVTVNREVHILGDIRCKSLDLHEDALVDGTIRAPDGVKIIREP
jgi:predicted acyltransferase (DUF342 family)